MQRRYYVRCGAMRQAAPRPKLKINLRLTRALHARSVVLEKKKMLWSGTWSLITKASFPFGRLVEGGFTTMFGYSGRRTRIQRLSSKLLHMFRETKALHLSWYINWYRFLVRAFAESIWRRVDPKGGGLVKNKLATTSSDVEFG